MAAVDPVRAMLRHTLATMVYRGSKTLRGAPEDFAAFKVGPTTRSPGEILAHIGDLLDWALALARGVHTWQSSKPRAWSDEVARFFAAVARFDEYLASQAPLGASPERLFQGPIADALVHFGQIAMLRRLAEAPVRGENYFKADIVAGRVGTDQAPAAFEFD